MPALSKKMSALLLVPFAALCIALGIVIGMKWEERTGGDSFHEVRGGGYQFINPLVECESGSESHRNRELRPFQYKVRDLTNRMLGERRATEISVYYRDLNNGPWFGINEDLPFAPASLLKVPVMIAYLKWAESEPHILRDKIVFTKADDKSYMQNYPPLKPLIPGTSYTVDELLFRMIAYSDNSADFLLFRKLPSVRLLAVFKDLNVDYDPGSKGDIMSVSSYAAFFRVLFNASYLNKEMSEKALKLLAFPEFNGGLLAAVPPDVQVVSKFGERVFIRQNKEIIQLHNVGIVYYPGRPFLLGVMTRGTDFTKQADAIRDITSLVYAEVDRQTRGMNNK